MYHLATAPRGIVQVLGSVFELTRASFLALLPFAVMLGAVYAIPLVYMLWSGALNDPAQMETLIRSAGYWMTSFVTTPLMFMAYGAAIVRAEAIAQVQPVDFREAIEKVLPNLMTIILASICFALVIAVGLVMLVIPGLILMVWLSFFLAAILLDGMGVFESLIYSYKLVWGNWWRTTAIVSITFIIIWVPYTLVVVVMIVSGVDLNVLLNFQLLLNLLMIMLVMPPLTALYVEIYRDLKMRKAAALLV